MIIKRFRNGRLVSEDSSDTPRRKPVQKDITIVKESTKNREKIKRGKRGGCNCSKKRKNK